MIGTRRVEQLEALLGTIQRNAARLSEERASRSAQRVTPTAAVAPEDVVRDEAPAPLVSSPPHEVPGAEATPAPVSGVAVSQPPGAREVIESIAPEEFDEIEELEDEVIGERSFGQSSRPPEPEAPSELELELTEELAAANYAAGQAAFPAPHETAVSESEAAAEDEHPSDQDLDGMGVSLGVSAPPGPNDYVPGSISEAMARVAAAESPRTPPPESGPQVSSPPKAAYFPELAADDAPVSLHSGPGPTVEQLGTTLDLEPAETAEAFELQSPSGGPAEIEDEYEANLPGARFAGGYDETLSAPPNAREDLEALDRAEAERAKRISLPPENSARAAPAEGSTPPAYAAEAERIGRAQPPLNVEPALYEGDLPKHSVPSFLQRLDRALRLK